MLVSSDNKPLISDAYKAQQEEMHSMYEYGTASKKYAPLVTEIINRLEIGHMLDYGCGKSTNLLKSIKPDHKLKYQGYDPGVPAFSSPPVPAELVACIDVLEHIEPDMLDNVLDHIASLTEAVAILTVHCGPAAKKLPDGRNAHLIQEPMEWWMPKLAARFHIQTMQRIHDHAFYMIGHPRGAIEAVDGSKLS